MFRDITQKNLLQPEAPPVAPSYSRKLRGKVSSLISGRRSGLSHLSHQIAGDELLVPHCCKSLVGVLLIFTFPIIFLVGGLACLPVLAVSCAAQLIRDMVHWAGALTDAIRLTHLIGPFARALALVALWVLSLPIFALASLLVATIEGILVGFGAGGAGACMFVWQLATTFDTENTPARLLHETLCVRGPALAGLLESRLIDPLIAQLQHEPDLHYVPCEFDPLVALAALLVSLVCGAVGALAFAATSVCHLAQWLLFSCSAGNECVLGCAECIDGEALFASPAVRMLGRATTRRPRRSARAGLAASFSAAKGGAGSPPTAPADAEAGRGHSLHSPTTAPSSGAGEGVGGAGKGGVVGAGKGVGAGAPTSTVRPLCVVLSEAAMGALRPLLRWLALLAYMLCAAVLIVAWALGSVLVGLGLGLLVGFGVIHAHVSRGLAESLDRSALVQAASATWRVIELNWAASGLPWRVVSAEHTNAFGAASSAIAAASRDVRQGWQRHQTIMRGELCREPAGLALTTALTTALEGPRLFRQRHFFALGPHKLRWYASREAFESAADRCDRCVDPLGELSLSGLEIELHKRARECTPGGSSGPRLVLRGRGALWPADRTRAAPAGTASAPLPMAVLPKPQAKLTLTLSDADAGADAGEGANGGAGAPATLLEWHAAIVAAARAKARRRGGRGSLGEGSVHAEGSVRLGLL